MALCEDFSDRDRIVVMLGDNILQDDISDAVENFEIQDRGAKIFLKEVDDPTSFGVAEIDGEKIKNLEEKPTKPKSNLAVIGLYMYDEQVWDVIKTLKPYRRGELEITDVNNFYINKDQMTFEQLSGWWGDGGESFDSLLEAGNLVAKK